MTLYAITGDARPVDQLEDELMRELLDVAERHKLALAGSESPWLPFLDVIEDETRTTLEVVR